MKPERIAQIYDRLVELVIELDPNPAARGPRYLQDLIARTRGYLNETSLFLQETVRDKYALEMRKNALEGSFTVRSDELLASDARVTRLPNIDDRKAMISVILGTEKRQIQEVETNIVNLGHVEKVIRHRHKELENTMSAIRLQRSLIETEVRTGSYLGDETNTSRGHRGYHSTQDDSDFDEAEIARLVDEAEQTGSEAPVVEVKAPEPAPEPQPVVVVAPVVHKAPKPPLSDEAAIAAFLDGDDDYSELFESI